MILTKVERSGSFADSTTCIVMRAVAWAEPSRVVTSVRNRHTSKVSAHSKYKQPLCRREGRSEQIDRRIQVTGERMEREELGKRRERLERVESAESGVGEIGEWRERRVEGAESGG